MKWLYMFVFLCVCVRLCFMFIWRTLTFLSYHCIDDMSDSFFCGDDKRCRLCGIVLHSIHHEFNENVWWELLFHFKKCNFSHFSYQNWSLHKAWTNFRDCDVTFENNSEFNKRSQKNESDVELYRIDEVQHECLLRKCWVLLLLHCTLKNLEVH